ncbi:PREDICTED: uncharacterized protein LOC107069119 [Polistes dominula]|uniref:Uncharacterized protein LOC107069119 n=1 Tax=Polistes dominula TaxID=743375 RepID=A0ABM1IN14_POLDO|nr:PREDICTED: uncharacterized protein LOC107069119 [Polistes dominula]
MDTPVLTKQQQRQSLSGKRSSNKLRNVLAQPHDNYWPVVKEEDKVKLNSILKELLPVLKRPSKKRRCIENESKEEQKVSDEPFFKRDMLNSVVLGVNTVTRSLEKDAVCCVLLDANVEPPLLIKHIVMMAQRKEIPFLLVPSLKVLTLETIGFSSTALGLKKIVLSSDHHFYKLYDIVLDISKNYPAPKRSLQTLFTDMDTEMTLDCTIIENDKVNDSVTKKESTFRVNEEFTSMESIYKYRSSCKERVFIPPNVICDDTKNIDHETSEFISLNDVNLNGIEIPRLQKYTRYFCPPSEKDKSNNDNTTYLPLKILQLRGNSNRTKATKAPKKKRPKINKIN